MLRSVLDIENMTVNTMFVEGLKTPQSSKFIGHIYGGVNFIPLEGKISICASKLHSIC